MIIEKNLHIWKQHLNYAILMPTVICQLWSEDFKQAHQALQTRE